MTAESWCSASEPLKPAVGLQHLLFFNLQLFNLLCLEFYSMSDALEQPNVPCGDKVQLLQLSKKDLYFGEINDASALATRQLHVQ